MPTRTTEAVVDQTLTELERPDQQRRIADVVASPGVRRAEQELVGGLVDASLDALADDERRRRISELVASYTAAVAADVPERVTPALTDALATSLGAALDRALTEERKSQLSALSAQIASAATAAMTARLAEGIRDDLGLALGEVVAAQAHAAGRHAVQGAEEALLESEEAKKQKGKDDDGAVSGLGRLASRGADLLVILAIVLALVVAVLLAWIAKLVAKAKRHEARG